MPRNSRSGPNQSQKSHDGKGGRQEPVCPCHTHVSVGSLRVLLLFCVCESVSRGLPDCLPPALLFPRLGLCLVWQSTNQQTSDWHGEGMRLSSLFRKGRCPCGGEGEGCSVRCVRWANECWRGLAVVCWPSWPGEFTSINTSTCG